MRTTTLLSPALRAGALAFCAAALALCAATLAGCARGDAPLDVVDPAAVPATVSLDQVMRIVTQSCTPCHKAGGDPPLESCSDVLRYAYDIEATTLGDNSMPPGAWPRLTSEERLVIRRWLDQGATGTCP